MTSAARVCAEEAVKRFSPQRALILCGVGNNGGDGLAMAPLLCAHAEVHVLLAQGPRSLKTPEARGAYARLDHARVPVETFRDVTRLRELLADADLVVDALLGSGVTGELREPYASIVKAVNAKKRPVLSVDVPTGFESRLAIHPTVTVALHDKKQGMTASNSGVIVVRDIGIPQAAATEVGPGDFVATYKPNPPGSHKGQNGRVLVVAGGPYTGAPILCSQAALRSGVDLVRLYAPTESTQAAQAAQPDLVVHPGVEPRRIVPEDAPRLRALYGRVDVVLLGPGLGDDRATVEAVTTILGDAAKARVRVVLDADAQAVAGAHPNILKRLKPLCTPHHGEFKELTGRSMPRAEAAQAALATREARRLGATLLVKGPVDFVTDGRRVKANRIHHPAMTTGGTGDVLAGLCAGFVAKGLTPFHAACAAAFVNGEAGRRVAARQGGALVASDLIREIPRLFRAFLR